MFKRKIALSLGAALLFISAVGCQMKSNNTTQTESSNNSSTTTVNMNQQESDFDLQFTGNDLDIGYDKENSTIITLNGTSAQIDGNGATVEDNKITITSAGTYIVSGSLDNGQLIVNAGELDKIKIVLEGANIHCDNNAPISIKQADKVFITLAEGTQNTVSDGSSYELSEDESTVDAAIFSKADVTFNGSGSLTVNANSIASNSSSVRLSSCVIFATKGVALEIFISILLILAGTIKSLKFTFPLPAFATSICSVWTSPSTVYVYVALAS